MYKIKRKELKKSARKVIKKHYLLLIIVCLIAAVIGSEFTDALTIFSSESADLKNLIELPTSISEGTQQIFGHTKGVINSVINSFGSGTIYQSAITAINSVINSEEVSTLIVIALIFIIAFVIWFFIGNTYSVISRRMFLESRIYKKTNAQRILFLFYVKKWARVSWIMFVKYFYNFLWYFVFIIGGVVKRYAYFLVPFILAENPNLKASQAITLSRKMMKGYKWQVFKLDLSYIGWFLLRIITLGLSGLFYSNAYQIAAYTEYYVELRKRAKENKIPGIEVLNDEYLYEKANKKLIEDKYSDMVKLLNVKKKDEKQTNKLESILNFFGITIKRKKEDEEKELEKVKEEHAKIYKDILNQDQYPTRLSNIKESSKRTKGEVSNYMVKYTISTLIIFFFIFCFIGWAWEVSLHLIRDGVFVNRGALHGPWLPIYGSGGLLILTVLYKLRRKVWIQFIAAVILCGFIEYFTSYFLEMAHDGMRWWNYSGYFLNLHGRICAEGLLIFGLGGIAVVYLLAPLLNNYIKKINHKVLIVISIILVTIFTVDIIYSHKHPNTGDGITSGHAQKK